MFPDGSSGDTTLVVNLQAVNVSIAYLCRCVACFIFATVSDFIPKGKVIVRIKLFRHEMFIFCVAEPQWQVMCDMIKRHLVEMKSMIELSVTYITEGVNNHVLSHPHQE